MFAGVWRCGGVQAASGGGTPVTGPVHEGKTTWAAGLRMWSQALAGAGGSVCALPVGLVRVAGGMRGEGRQIGHHR